MLILTVLVAAAGMSLPAVRIAPEAPLVEYKQPQLAVTSGLVAVTFGAGDAVYFAASRDGGRTFAAPVKLPDAGKLALGRHRGPRIAASANRIVISAVIGKKGGGADGDLLAWRSSDGGRTWTEGVRINDAVSSAREGLHAMAAAGNGLVFAAWLDSRSGHNQIYGAHSRDNGATWSRNRLVYASPDGHTCECCHPSLAIDPRGRIYIMWRNWLNGARDMYLASSDDGGETFSAARKLGDGTWPLNACPMDGGGLSADASGSAVTVWRRASEIFLNRPGARETRLGAGKDPAIAAGRDGVYAAWSAANRVALMRPGATAPEILGDGGYVQLAGDGPVIAAWESNGAIVVKVL